MSAPSSAIADLRRATAASHDAVDAAFGAHDLADRDAYRRFLVAHARALPAVEAAMRPLPFARTLAARTPLLHADIAALGEPLPPPLSFAVEDDAARWGVLYVVEGSRLGGAMLAGHVPADRPRAYLAAVHPPGQWRAIRAAIDAAAAGRDAGWHARMIDGALRTFALYREAAGA
ncbi:MAG: biliverdin-producing heme oxygenase [Sphingomonas adhaesiva]|uniref:biliverdin-producing heme oxygenase n=1 Tax=Sphingomonas adhaesiva TaxID=28212 RepID=UPI002FFACBD8